MWPVREVEPSGSPDLGSPLIKPLTFTYTENYVKRRLCTCLFTSFHVLKIDANQLTHTKHSTCSKLSFFIF